MEDEMYDLEAIRARVSIEELAEEAGARLRNGSGRCVLHEGSDNPTAFHVYDQGRRWHCFTRCGEGANDGDVFTFWMRLRGVDFRAAVEALAQRAGLDGDATPGVDHPEATVEGKPAAERRSAGLREGRGAPSEQWMGRAGQFAGWAYGQLRDGQQGRGALAYLRSERGLSEETLERYTVGFCPRDYRETAERWGLEGDDLWLPRGIVIPGMREGRPWYLKIRRPVDEDGLGYYIGHTLSGPKFSGPRGGRQTVYGMELWTRRPALLLTEGEWDCMTAWQAGREFLDAASLGGAGARLDLETFAVLATYALVMVVSDDDEAGEQARRWWTGQGLGARVRVLRPPAHDLSAFWQEGGNLGEWLRREALAAAEGMEGGGWIAEQIRTVGK